MQPGMWYLPSCLDLYGLVCGYVEGVGDEWAKQAYFQDYQVLNFTYLVI